VAVRFIWDKENTEHVVHHGVDPDLAERIFSAADRLMFPVDGDRTRFIVEGTVAGRTYRMVSRWSARRPSIQSPPSA
jgi:uncharacterized DUF497 family protein